MVGYSFDCAATNLLCAETHNLFFDDLDSTCPDEQTLLIDDRNPIPKYNNGSQGLMGFPLQTVESFNFLIEREKQHLPKNEYLNKLRTGELDLNVRKEALDWILKAHAHFSFGPLSVCLSVNYLDRFLSIYELPRGQTWAAQLLAVACLSVAIKMEEIKVPPNVVLQVGDPKFLFEGKTIKRMELLLLSSLNWRMQACTPFTFIDYFLRKMNNDQDTSGDLITKSIQLILSIIRGIDFLEFRGSEIAAAVAISVLGEIQEIDIDKAMSGFVLVHKGRVLKCVELMKDVSLINGSKNVATSNGFGPIVPQSPIGVLDGATCLSYKSDVRTVGSCSNSSDSSPATKRRKLDKPSFEGTSSRQT